MHFNALVTLLLPVAAVYGILCYRRILCYGRWMQPHPPRIALYAAFALMIVFTAIRNLPLGFF
jgi:hypothetical protein